jgi:hypothetical protein
VKLKFNQLKRAKKIKIPTVSEELAEDIGIQIGDGSIGYWKNSKGGRSFIIEVCGNMIEEEKYLITQVKQLKKRLYGVHVSCHKNNSAGTITIRVYSKNLVFFYKNLGFPIGQKDNISIPKFVFSDKKFQISCLRGLIDTDGSLSFNKGSHKNHSNPVIHFTTKSKPLAKQVCKILDNLKFNYTINFDSKQYDKRTNKTYIKNNIYISGKKNLEKWMKTVGFHNIAQFSKYLVYKKIGYCPPHTNLQQRFKILE